MKCDLSSCLPRACPQLILIAYTVYRTCLSFSAYELFTLESQETRKRHSMKEQVALLRKFLGKLVKNFTFQNGAKVLAAPGAEPRTFRLLGRRSHRYTTSLLALGIKMRDSS